MIGGRRGYHRNDELSDVCGFYTDEDSTCSVLCQQLTCYLYASDYMYIYIHPRVYTYIYTLCIYIYVHVYADVTVDVDVDVDVYVVQSLTLWNRDSNSMSS